MARIFTTPEMEATAKAFLHDITFAAGLHSNNKRNMLFNYMTDSNYKQNASTVCDELVNRNFDDVDKSINFLARQRFYSPLVNPTSTKHLKPEGVAKSIVYMAEQLGIYWDDTIRTPYEVDAFKRTLLGSAVYKYGRYISAIKDKTSRSKSSSSATASTGGATKAAGQQPKNNYKQTGPQSGNVRDLHGQPGEKVIANTNLIYKIVGDDPKSKNTPNVFIKPLSDAGKTGNTNKIFISSGNGYTDCTCFFDEPNNAQDFLDKIEAAGRVPANVSNLRVVKSKADSNGYFLVGTEFGECAISAKKLNEALEGDPNERPVSWEKATESYSQEELDELHTWMRRD